jgi:hypothetical protein
VGSSAGRRSAAYKTAARTFRTGDYPCWLASGPWCTGKGTTVEHDPPLSSFPHWSLWRGRYRPACKPCQDRQGAAIRNAASTGWQW